MKNLKVTIVQTEIIWHNTEENLNHIEYMIKKNNPQSDLIVLPEMFNTGFTMNPEEAAEKMNGTTVVFLKRLAREINADIAGSIAIKENGTYYNRLIWVKPDGELFTYDKRHLFRMAGEEKVYSCGNSHLTVNLKGWKIRPFICYDLRFPVWIRNTGNEYDLALFTANWPAARGTHWNILLRARAVENQCYVAAVNRTGHDGNDVLYRGKSLIVNFNGEIMFKADDCEHVHTVELSYTDLLTYRESFPAWKDGDQFKLC